MTYRVYDNKRKVWLKDNIYLNPDGELFRIKKLIFGMVKTFTALSSDRYIYHQDINLYDKDGDLVFEGDYILASVDEGKEVIGMVCYAHELSSYIILVDSTQEFFTLGSEVTKYIKVIGNIFDGYKEVNNNDEPTLSEAENEEGKIY